MSNKDVFIKKLMETGKVSDDEIVLFLLEEYFVNGKSIEDFQDDLTGNYDCENSYALIVKEASITSINKYVKRYSQTCETWEEEQQRLNG